MASNHRKLIRIAMGTSLLLGALLWVVYGWLAPFPYRQAIEEQARNQHLNPYLVAAVVRVESGFRPVVVSRRGAIGLMQLMPSTGQWVAQQNGWRSPPLDLSDPEFNLRVGTWYLRYLLTTFKGQPTLALAAYNGGIGNVQRWMAQGILSSQAPQLTAIPYPETRHFVRKVLWYEKVYHLMYGELAVHTH